MSIPEVLHRVEAQLRQASDRRRGYGWNAFRRPGPLPVFPGLRHAVLFNRPEGLEAAIRASCESILAGEFEALGVCWPNRSPQDLFPAELWRLDPVTGGLWPGADRFFVDTDYRHQTQLGSVKYVWEMNRLQFLQPLAAFYVLEGDARALGAIEAAISSWFDANPPFRGMNWNSGIELALRAVSLVATATLCGDALNPKVRQQIRSILAATFHWLDRYPSRFSSANNHLITEALGLFMIGELVPDLPGARGVASRARTLLERETQAQILPDGVGAEQSPTYSALVAETILTGALLAHGLGKPLDGRVDRRLHAFADYIAWFSLPAGETPAIGDDDEGRIWNTLGPRESAYPASIAAAVAGYLGQPAVGPVSGQPELRDAVFGSPRQAAGPPSGVKSFPEGGYTVVRETRMGRDLHLVMDHGPLGYLSIAAHGHADANALTLSVDGAPVLIDPGTFMYHALNDWRSWFRGTRAHNTLTIEGVDQSQIAGPFMWSHKANARLERLEQGAIWRITASQDGYRRRFGVDHFRSVSAFDEGLVIVDTLEPAPVAGPVEVVFQFAPEIAVVPDGARILISRAERPLMTLEFDVKGEIKVDQGGEGYDQGWASLRFGHKTPAPRLSWHGVLPPEGLTTRLRLIRKLNGGRSKLADSKAFVVNSTSAYLR